MSLRELPAQFFWVRYVLDICFRDLTHELKPVIYDFMLVSLVD
jgi:hypothetical protein